MATPMLDNRSTVARTATIGAHFPCRAVGDPRRGMWTEGCAESMPAVLP